MVRHQARRSLTLVFEGELSSAQTSRRRSRKQPKESKVRVRDRRQRPRRHIGSWAADIPEVVENVEDPDPSIEFLTRRQGRHPEISSERPYH